MFETSLEEQQRFDIRGILGALASFAALILGGYLLIVA